MAFYESIVIIRQELSSTEVDKIAEDIKNIILTHKGEIIKTEYWGLRTLAYEIQNNRKGHYYFFGIKADKAALDELDRKIKLSESIIRFSLVRVKTISSDPSPILKSKDSDGQNTIDVTLDKTSN
ncbi:MAG TPA: 30S ribosomal protein S6 [Candidatus Megaira endosymbiont of Nemacystus decipiens]|nr:30S ribosomal protein S6 [Candidatus Megaera endosymbiont of Nemacystus decipiens]